MSLASCYTMCIHYIQSSYCFIIVSNFENRWNLLKLWHKEKFKCILKCLLYNIELDSYVIKLFLSSTDIDFLMNVYTCFVSTIPVFSGCLPIFIEILKTNFSRNTKLHENKIYQIPSIQSNKVGCTHLGSTHSL